MQKCLPTIPALAELDEPVIEYLSGLVGAEGVIKSSAHLVHVLAELLVSYDVCENEAAAATICEALFDKLVKAGACKAPAAAKPAAAAAAPAAKGTAAATSAASAASSSSSAVASSASVSSSSTPAPAAKGVIAPPGYRWIVATEKLRARIQTGVEVLGRNPKDSRWYAARIEGVAPASEGTFTVCFPEMDRATAKVDLSGVKVLEKIPYLDAEVEREVREGGWNTSMASEADRLNEWGASSEAESNGGGGFNPFGSGSFVIRKLKEAIVIGEFGITAADKADAALDAKLLSEKKERARILTKREIKERKLAELEVKREIARQKALEQKKFEALKRYLAAEKTGKPTDVDLVGVGLSTPEGTQELLSNASLKFVTGRRYGLIGRNGVGKTSLMRAISSYDIPDFPVHLRVVHVEQEVTGDETSVVESVLQADIERHMLMEEERKLMRSLKADEVAAAKDLANQRETDLKAAREAARAVRLKKMRDEEADSAARLGASVDHMLDSMKALDVELDGLDEDEAGLEDVDDIVVPAETTEDDDEDTSAIDAELAKADEDDDDDDDDVEEKSASASSGSRSKSKRGKINKSARDAAKKKNKEVQLPESKILDPAVRLTQIYSRMNEIDAWGAEARARTILNGLQFSGGRQHMKTRELSGGQAHTQRRCGGTRSTNNHFAGVPTV